MDRDRVSEYHWTIVNQLQIEDYKLLIRRAAFLGATAIACIGFTISATQDTQLSWGHTCILAACGFWIYSLYCAHGTTKALGEMLRGLGSLHSVHAGGGSDTVKDLFRQNPEETTKVITNVLHPISARVERLHERQLYGLAIGGLLFAVWHITQLLPVCP